jgi:hypothetical protein
MTDDATPAFTQRVVDAMDQITTVADDLLDVLPEITDRPSIGMFGLMMAAAKIGVALALPPEKLQEALLAMYTDAQRHEKERSNEH